MTTKENPKDRSPTTSAFGFRHSFVIRHWFFVILSLALMLVLEISCVGRRLSKANVDEVTEGMSKKQVESILGPPTNIDNRDFIVMKKTTYVYRQGKDTVTIVFKDDKMTDKQSTLSD
jgi:outer membrane protein assembly factor BamE (lipoprotein component of BamABCDE complex)